MVHFHNAGLYCLKPKRILFHFFLKIILIVCVFLECSGALRGQKSVLDSWELELQVAMICPAWVLGTQLKSSEGGACTFKV